jgi:hypothetical protein
MISSLRQHRLPRVRRLFFFAAALLSGHSVTAHSQTGQPAGGVISGHVFLADNDKPARFATVYLKPMSPPSAGDDFFTELMDSSIVNMQSKRLGGSSPSSQDDNDLKSARSAVKGFLSHVSDAMLSATVGQDGEYLFKNVPPGSYYVHVHAPGYVDTLNEFTDEELASQDAALRRKVAATVNSVSIVATEQVRENLRIDRGAVVSGHILFDDGSPAAGWTVRAIAKRNAAASSPGNILGIDMSSFQVDNRFPQAVTDDTGLFRIAGLPSGEFLLEASLVTAALDRQPFTPVDSSAGSFLSILGGLSGLHGLRLVVYSGSALRMHDAEVLSLRAGEERHGLDMVARLRSARSIAGLVVSQNDGHPVNSGDVELIAQDKDGKEDPSSRLSAPIQPDGSFRFDFVPAPGTYTLRSLHPRDTSVSSTMKLLGSLIAEHKTLRGYASASAVVDLQDEDLKGIRVSVTDLPAVVPTAAFRQ